MGLSGGAIAGIVIGCVVFVVAKTACKHTLLKSIFKIRAAVGQAPCVTLCLDLQAC